MTNLPPCPIEGCKSESDHHCHRQDGSDGGIGEDLSFFEGYCPCDRSNGFVTVCYSRALKPASLMLSVETVAKLIEAAETAAYDRGWRHGWDDCERMRLTYALQDWDQP